MDINKDVNVDVNDDVKSLTYEACDTDTLVARSHPRVLHTRASVETGTGIAGICVHLTL